MKRMPWLPAYCFGMAQRPRWLQVREVQTAPDAELTGQLDPGEAEAIQLARSFALTHSSWTNAGAVRWPPVEA
jgi:hypothetical protein